MVLSRPEEVAQLLSGKLALKYGDKADVIAMKNVAEAARKRSLKDFKGCQEQFKEELDADEVVKAHFNTLYDKMLQQNLLRIIEPYSKVEVSNCERLRVFVKI